MKGEIDIVSKGWGFEKIIHNSPDYCGKLLHIIKDKKTSLHYHKIKDETFYIQSGRVKVYYLEEGRSNWWGAYANIPEGADQQSIMELYSKLQSIVLHAGDSFRVPVRTVHQIIALEETEMFEFSTQHFDEDSIRLVKGD